MPQKASRKTEPDLLILKDEHEKLKVELRKWKKKYQDFEAEQQSLKHENEKLREEKKAWNGNLRRTKVEYGELRSRFQELTLQNQELEREKKSWREEYEGLETKLAEVEANNEMLQTKAERMMVEIQLLGKNPREGINDPTRAIRALSSLMIDQEFAALASNQQSHTTSDVSQYLWHDLPNTDDDPTCLLSRADARRHFQYAGATLVSSRHSTATFNDSHVCTTLCQLRCSKHVKRLNSEDETAGLA